MSSLLAVAATLAVVVHGKLQGIVMKAHRKGSVAAPQLCDLINQYRQGKGLGGVPLHESLMQEGELMNTGVFELTTKGQDDEGAAFAQLLTSKEHRRALLRSNWEWMGCGMDEWTKEYKALFVKSKNTCDVHGDKSRHSGAGGWRHGSDEVGTWSVWEGPEGEDQPEGHRRRLPSSGTLTSGDNDALLDKHNTLRGEDALRTYATDMTDMAWNSDLAAEAKSWADGCKWEHGSYGENLYASYSSSNTDSSLTTLLNGLQGWYDEYQYYTYSTRTCQSGEMCGHYTQMVWADSIELGCGYAVCKGSDMGFSWPYAHYLVCRYLPYGNYNGQYPYTKGSSSSDVATECPSSGGYTSCPAEGLCKKYTTCSSGGTTSGSTTTTTTTTTSTTRAGEEEGEGTGEITCTRQNKCSVTYTVMYPSTSASDAWNVVNDANSEAVSKTATSGWAWSASYSSSYSRITVKMSKDTDIEAFHAEVSSESFRSGIEGEMKAQGLLSSGSVTIDVQDIVSGTSGSSAKSSGGSSSSNKKKTAWWVWFLVILAALFVGAACAFGFMTWRSKKGAKGGFTHQTPYQQMADFN